MYRLIIVDDEKLIRNGLSRYVEDNAEEFDVAGEFDDGAPALEYLLGNAGQVDVVIADIKMKNMSGIELAGQIRSHNIDVKIVFISGYEEFEYARKAIEYKVFSYLLKPLRFEQLDNMFRELVKELKGKEKPDVGMSEINSISDSKYEKTEERNKSDDYKEQILLMAMEYINENYCREVSLVDVAEHVHLNPVYLGRIFKQRFGTTVMDCLIRIKMHKAKEMLVNTDKKVKEIAQLVGYSNENYFITIFKKNTGMTPKKYRLEKRL